MVGAGAGAQLFFGVELIARETVNQRKVIRWPKPVFRLKRPLFGQKFA
jgi:hypothetical protein